MNLLLADHSIRNIIELAAEKHEYIDIVFPQRAIGKTKALIDFAKDLDSHEIYGVIVKEGLSADNLRKDFKYKGIYTMRQVRRLDGYRQKIVFDEGVDVNELRKYFLPDQILTGFRVVN